VRGGLSWLCSRCAVSRALVFSETVSGIWPKLTYAPVCIMEVLMIIVRLGSVLVSVVSCAFLDSIVLSITP